MKGFLVHDKQAFVSIFVSLHSLFNPFYSFIIMVFPFFLQQLCGLFNSNYVFNVIQYLLIDASLLKKCIGTENKQCWISDLCLPLVSTERLHQAACNEEGTRTYLLFTWIAFIFYWLCLSFVNESCQYSYIYSWLSFIPKIQLLALNWHNMAI